MCGRFTLREFDTQFLDRFSRLKLEQPSPQFNIAPSQGVLALRGSPAELCTLRWGLIPSWAKEESIGHKMINARAETLSEKPSFKRLLSSKRCLILADGFYEWKKNGAKKQPFYIHLKSGKVFGFAGLWDHWKSPETGEVIETCTIITGEPNETVRPIHDRMPRIITADKFEEWLDVDIKEPERIKNVLRSIAPDLVEAYPVSTFVNKPSNDSEECVRKIEVV